MAERIRLDRAISPSKSVFPVTYNLLYKSLKSRHTGTFNYDPIPEMYFYSSSSFTMSSQHGLNLFLFLWYLLFTINYHKNFNNFYLLYNSNYFKTNKNITDLQICDDNYLLIFHDVKSTRKKHIKMSREYALNFLYQNT